MLQITETIPCRLLCSLYSYRYTNSLHFTTDKGKPNDCVTETMAYSCIISYGSGYLYGPVCTGMIDLIKKDKIPVIQRDKWFGPVKIATFILYRQWLFVWARTNKHLVSCIIPSRSPSSTRLKSVTK